MNQPLCLPAWEPSLFLIWFLWGNRSRLQVFGELSLWEYVLFYVGEVPDFVWPEKSSCRNTDIAVECLKSQVGGGSLYHSSRLRPCTGCWTGITLPHRGVGSSEPPPLHPSLCRPPLEAEVTQPQGLQCHCVLDSTGSRRPEETPRKLPLDPWSRKMPFYPQRTRPQIYTPESLSFWKRPGGPHQGELRPRVRKGLNPLPGEKWVRGGDC